MSVEEADPSIQPPVIWLGCQRAPLCDPPSPPSPHSRGAIVLSGSDCASLCGERVRSGLLSVRGVYVSQPVTGHREGEDSRQPHAHVRARLDRLVSLYRLFPAALSWLLFHTRWSSFCNFLLLLGKECLHFHQVASEAPGSISLRRG